MSDPINFNISTPRLYITYYRPDIRSHTGFIWTATAEGRPPSERRPPTDADHAAAAADLVSVNETQLVDGYGVYLVLLKRDLGKENEGKQFADFREDLEKIGHVTMRLRKHNGASRVPDTGFRIVEEHWRKGYAIEASSALMEYFRKEKGLKDFFGYCAPGNEGSKAMLRKLGFENRGMRILRGVGGSGLGEEDWRVLVWARPHMESDLGVYGLKAEEVQMEDEKDE
ncbi:hypothetical protein EJ04DRAFT_513768 [Polyplosphaeria fusca]|uniref:N-acetyltransferase domain-containing protein n=1 Tax=Polyplosphaeria fusca TaxID=682080 RepID=A0A9P4QWS9_9PLEO|nr:hypothetical protein EJ04DRAFT_513768 [Polyplosphaeria fusca]